MVSSAIGEDANGREVDSHERAVQTAPEADHHGGVPTALLVLPTTAYRVSDYLDAAASLGVEVAIASEEDQALADRMGEQFLRIDLHRPEWSADRIVERSHSQAIDAIVPVDDQGVLVAALAARRLGLAHNPPDAVALTRNKAGMRRAMKLEGVPQPDFRVVGGRRRPRRPGRRDRPPRGDQAALAQRQPRGHPGQRAGGGDG